MPGGLRPVVQHALLGELATFHIPRYRGYVPYGQSGRLRPPQQCSQSHWDVRATAVPLPEPLAMHNPILAVGGTSGSACGNSRCCTSRAAYNFAASAMATRFGLDRWQPWSCAARPDRPCEKIHHIPNTRRLSVFTSLDYDLRRQDKSSPTARTTRHPTTL